MSAYFAGFICAIVLAALIIIWIAYCMFFKERHKSELYQYDIGDIKAKSEELAEKQKHSEKRTEISAGIIILPSRKKHKDESNYEKRPDYPESPVHHFQPGQDKLIEAFTESVVDSEASKNDVFEIESNAQYQSDV